MKLLNNQNADPKTTRNNRFKNSVTKKQMLFRVALLTVWVIGLSGWYLVFEWHRYQQMAANEAIQLALSVESLLHVEHVANLSAAAGDLDSPDYKMIKKSFIDLVAATNPYHFAYLMQEKEGRIIFLIDSEPPDSPDYSPPGQIYDEADAVLWDVFNSGQTVLSQPSTDRWGTWISVLVPVKDPRSGETLAVFGLDYAAAEWNAKIWQKMVPDLIIVFATWILFSTLLYIAFQNQNIRRLAHKTALDEALYRNVFDQTPVGIAVLEDKRFLSQSQLGSVNINPMFEKILARSSADLEQLKWPEITHPDDLKEDLEQFDLFYRGEIPGYSMEKRFLRPDGSSVWTNMKVAPLRGLPYPHSMHLCLIDDITKRKATEAALQRALERTQSMINNHEAVMLLIKPESGQIIEANTAASQFYGYTKQELLSMTIQDINTLDKQALQALRMQVLNKGHKYFTFPHRLQSGAIRMVDVYSSPIDYDDQKVLFSIIFDVTAREEIATQNEFLAYHDYLTGVYNRRYFEAEFKRRVDRGEFPISILRGNVDAFKDFNIDYGHLEGDQLLIKVAQRISARINDRDTLARIGGDDFAILVSGKHETEIRQYLDKLNHHTVNDFMNLEKYKRVDVSWGYGIQRNKKDPLDQIYDEAEAYMNNRKYYNQKSIRSKTIDVIMQTLFIKSEREKRHSERVGKLCEKTAAKLNLNKSQLDKVRVAGYLHDIGKIGIDETILNKPGRLDPREWEIMKLHPAKSAEILATTREYADIAEIVRSHHERYDGSGYPKGLSGAEIPLMARIIAISDAYDAMTEKRTYRDPLSKAEAVAELKKCAGTHFDPEIVAVFVNEVIGVEKTDQ